MNFYLSPKDYHRYHAPVDFKLKKLIHVPGKLYPVNLKYLNKEFELFVQNERVVLECEKDGKIFYMVFVGALNVGQMVFEFEPRVETNKDTKEIKVYTYENIEISKADCLGYFKMGSTVVMIWEKDFVVLENLLNQNVKFGQKIAKFEELKNAYNKRAVFEYGWNRIYDPYNYTYQKISWVEYNQKLNWYITSSVYKDDFSSFIEGINSLILNISMLLFGVLSVIGFLLQ
jgi:hypothetical protein